MQRRTSFNPAWGISERLYMQDVERHPHLLMRRIAAVLTGSYMAAGELVKGLRVLDIACGSGYGTRILRDAGASEVVGCDLDESPLTHARLHHARDGMTFVQGNAESFTWSHRFDVVCSFETIEHLAQPMRLLDRIEDLLTPDGTLCLSVPLGETRHLDPFHQTIFTETEIRDALTKRGFVVEHTSCQELAFRCRDLWALGRRMPETRPTYADLFLTRRGWWTLVSLLRGLGAIRFSQFFLIARRAAALEPAPAFREPAWN